MSKITLINNGEIAQSIQNHMAGRVLVPAGETVVINLNPAKDITSQAFLKKFYNQYKPDLEIEYDIDDYPLDLDVEVTTEGAAQDFDMFGTPVSDLQEADVAVVDGAVTGTLKYLAEGALVDKWGAGNFLALQFGWDDDDERITDVKVGLDPSATGMALQSIFSDPDRNGAWKISNKNEQKFVIEIYEGEKVTSQALDLSGLVCKTGPLSGAAKDAGKGGVDVVASAKVTAKDKEDAPKEEAKEEAPKAAKKSTK